MAVLVYDRFRRMEIISYIFTLNAEFGKEGVVCVY